jgi:lipopolysaccharide biosynthesis glycosyltransferase
MNGKIPVCFSTDDNYAQHMGVCMASVLKNKHENDEIYFYVLDGGISEKNKRKILKLKSIAGFEIEFIKVDKTIFVNCPIKDIDYVSLATYYRLILPDVCKHEDKLIYLDCDIIVRSSLSGLMAENLDGYYAGAVEDKPFRAASSEFCNAGVLLINAKSWREDNITDKLFEYIANNSEKIPQHDQDTLNLVLNDKIKRLAKCYNVQVSWTEFEAASGFDEIESGKTAVIIHYVGNLKPWNYANSSPFAGLYFEYIKLTPWRWFGVCKRFIRFVQKILRT